MEAITEFIQQNQGIAIGGAVIFILIAVFIIKKLKFLAIVFILLASFIVYSIFFCNDLEKTRVDDIRKRVKTRIIEKI